MALTKKIEFYRHNLEPEDSDKVLEVLQSIFLTTGEVTAEFEQKFSRVVELPYVVGLTSCTAALHLSLIALGIGPGDEVITTPMTFLATATAILHAGARPVFADVEPETGLINPKEIEKVITKKTRAVLPVHLYGCMADMKAIRSIATRHGLRILEDCAHSIESERDGVRPGQLSDLACYSFYATKNLTSGEGGAIATRDKNLAEKVRMLRQHGINKDASSRYTGRFTHWDMETLGWKYNMDNIHAALLVRQIDRLNPYWERRKKIAEMYHTGLKNFPGITLPELRGKSAYHLQTVWVDPELRDLVISKMQDRGIGVAVNYRAIHTLKYFRQTFGFKPEDFPRAFSIGSRTLSIPLYPKITDDEAAYVIESLKEILSGLKKE